jgi:hypothetical protein
LIRRFAVILGLLVAAPAVAGPSVFVKQPEDAQAVTAKAPNDGRTDASAALQAAIDAAENKGAGGVVFVPSGRYRVTRTIMVWPGVRVIGAGATRPVLVLAPNSPGFQTGVKNMVIFAGRGRAGAGAFKVPFPPPGSVPFDETIADANSGTFYSAMSNIDVEIGAGNPAAAAIRQHGAQHSFLSHMDFDLGGAFAGVYMVGNLGADLHFRGGRYGIVTEKTSPAWQYTLLDSSFDGQRDAGIREHEAQLTLVNVAFRNAPVGVEIDKGYGDWLFGKDVRFENIASAGVIVSNENNAFTQIGFQNALAGRTPVFVRFRDSGRAIGQAGAYRVRDFSYGLTLSTPGATGKYATLYGISTLPRLPAPAAPAVRALPPTSEWTNVRDLGAKGDGKTDDAAALQAAIASHRVLYFPSGFYSVSDTLKLRPDTVLIGLHPGNTQIWLPDGTPAFQGVGTARALVEAPQGGNNIVSGIGLATNGINARATALLWQAGANSLVDDVKIQGGHGTTLPDLSRYEPYNDTHSADRDPRKRWDAQYPSIWVTNGGGGSFVDLWSPSTWATAGFAVSDTRTPGHIYQVSTEHHVRTEFSFDRVENWELLATQTEEEAGESQDAVSLDIRNSRNLLIANHHAYRVTRSVKPARMAIRLENVSDLRFRNLHVNGESGFATCDANGCATYLRASKYPFENAVVDVTHGIDVREREFAALDVPAAPVRLPVQGQPVTKIADGFWSISGAAIDSAGTLYFVDRKFQRIYRWSEAGGIAIERDQALDPVNLAFDKSGNLVVLSFQGPEGTVYSFKPGAPGAQITVIPPTPAAPHADARIALPVNWWNNGEFRDQYDPATDHFTTLGEMFARDMAAPRTREYVSPDGSLVLPAYRTFAQGPSDHLGWRFSDALDTYGFALARPGSRVFLSNGSEDITYSGLLGAGGVVTDLKPFANRGGESVAVGPDGRVFIANGQVFVYDAAGNETGRIDVAERPLQLLFGGADGKTLYILTHHALYSTRP